MSQLDLYMAVRRGEWSAQTYETYKRLLSSFVVSFPDPAAATVSEVSEWLYRPSWGDNQRYVALEAVKGFMKWLGGENHPVVRLKIKRREGPPQRTLTGEQLERLLESFNTGALKGVRDLAMCALMVDTGLRASEVCALSVDHLNIVECSFGCKVKGGRWANGVFSQTTARYLLDWLHVRKAAPGVSNVFVHVHLGEAMTRQGLRTTVRRWGIEAGIGVISPHDLRRTMAVLATRAGAPGRIVQAAGRWSSLKMVEHYTRAIDASDMKPYFPVSRAMGEED